MEKEETREKQRGVRGGQMPKVGTHRKRSPRRQNARSKGRQKKNESRLPFTV